MLYCRILLHSVDLVLSIHSPNTCNLDCCRFFSFVLVLGSHGCVRVAESGSPFLVVGHRVCCYIYIYIRIYLYFGVLHPVERILSKLLDLD
jgi:hypothetical protein